MESFQLCISTQIYQNDEQNHIVIILYKKKHIFILCYAN